MIIKYLQSYIAPFFTWDGEFLIGLVAATGAPERPDPKEPRIDYIVYTYYSCLHRSGL